MYLLSNNISKVIFFIISVVILIIQINLPSIIIYENNKINLDLFLIFLTFLVFIDDIDDSYRIIYIAFFFGLFQDIIINSEQLGLFSFLKSLTVYLLLGIRSYDAIWDTKIKLACVLCIYFLHFLFYYLVIYDGFYLIIFLVSFLQSAVCFIIYYLFNRFFLDIK